MCSLNVQLQKQDMHTMPEAKAACCFTEHMAQSTPQPTLGPCPPSGPDCFQTPHTINDPIQSSSHMIH